MILWPAVGLVLFTGLVNLMNVWYATVATAGSISPTFVSLLSVKLGIVIGMIALQAVEVADLPQTCRGAEWCIC